MRYNVSTKGALRDLEQGDLPKVKNFLKIF